MHISVYNLRNDTLCPKMISASNGHAECLKVLLENSEDKNAVDVRDHLHRFVTCKEGKYYTLLCRSIFPIF